MRTFPGIAFVLVAVWCSSVYAHTISINDVVVTEKDSGTVNATFTLTLSAPGPGDDSVTVFTADGTATFAGGDYNGLLQNVVFPQGTLTQTVTVTVLSDDVPELNEFFYARLTNSTAAIGDGEGIGTILDDDSDSPGLSIDSVLLTEGDSGTLDTVLTVLLSESAGTDVTVDYATADATATSGDYTSVSNVLTIPNGQLSGTIMVPVVGDTTAETNEFLFVNLSNPTNATIVQGQGTIIIRDNEGTYLFSAFFDDGSLDPNWTYGSGWTENSSGELFGTAIKKTSAVASPIYGGCIQCSVAAPVRTSGGSGNKISLFGWYTDKRNTVEIKMKEEVDKWIIKMKQDGETVVKEKLLMPILPNVDYQWFVLYDGSRFLFLLDSVLVKTIIPPFAPQGTFGFQVKAATGTFGELIVN